MRFGSIHIYDHSTLRNWVEVGGFHNFIFYCHHISLIRKLREHLEDRLFCWKGVYKWFFIQYDIKKLWEHHQWFAIDWMRKSVSKAIDFIGKCFVIILIFINIKLLSTSLPVMFVFFYSMNFSSGFSYKYDSSLHTFIQHDFFPIFVPQLYSYFWWCCPFSWVCTVCTQPIWAFVLLFCLLFILALLYRLSDCRHVCRVFLLFIKIDLWNQRCLQ